MQGSRVEGLGPLRGLSLGLGFEVERLAVQGLGGSND